MKNALTLSGFIAALSALPALAQDGLPTIGKPTNGNIGFQPAATELASGIHQLDGMILVIITVVCVFVAGLLLYAIFKFNRKANPEPASFTHHSVLEVAWTVVPILILIVIGSFSLPQLFKQQEIPEADITIKVTGYQWYWGYDYVDHEFGYESFLLDKDQLSDHGYNADEYLLATDTAVVVPSGKTIVMQVTGADVIHSWAMPAFGVKQDAVPGRLAELWFEVEEGKEGIYFGQCSELCGKDHSYMPITVKVVTQDAYEAWLAGAIDEYAGKPLDYQVALN